MAAPLHPPQPSDPLPFPIGRLSTIPILRQGCNDFVHHFQHQDQRGEGGTWLWLGEGHRMTSVAEQTVDQWVGGEAHPESG